MGKSARILGQNYGLTAQEMNYLLKEEGFLTGDADGYSITDKGAPYATEKDYHRGTGGYAHYNRHWTTRTWDDSIEDVLNISEDMIDSARDAVAASRKLRWEEIKAAREEADARFLASNNNKSSEETDNEHPGPNEAGALGRIVLLIGGFALIGYGIYKAVPYVISWWSYTVMPKLISAGMPIKTKKQFRKGICPACGEIQELDDVTLVWHCNKCTYTFSDKDANVHDDV